MHWSHVQCTKFAEFFSEITDREICYGFLISKRLRCFRLDGFQVAALWYLQYFNNQQLFPDSSRLCKTLVHALVTSWLNQGNSVQYGFTNAKFIVPCHILKGFGKWAFFCDQTNTFEFVAGTKMIRCAEKTFLRIPCTHKSAANEESFQTCLLHISIDWLIVYLGTHNQASVPRALYVAA